MCQQNGTGRLVRAFVVSCLWSWIVAATAGAAPPDQQPAGKPDCLVSDVAATAKPSPTTIAMDARKSIFIDLEQAVARALREAAAAYPNAEGGALLGPTNVQKDSKLAGKRDNMARSLERTYLAEVLRKRTLTCTAAREITREGRASHWPTKS
jgi:hypothetical protein